MRQAFPGHSLGTLCGLFGKTRQAYYDMSTYVQSTDIETAVIIKLVEELREQMPRIGTRKLFHELQEPLKRHKIQIGRDALFSLLADFGLLIRVRRRKAKTTWSDHPFRKYKNLIKDITLSESEQLWVSDITYIAVGEGFNYLSLITDAYSRKVVGYHLCENLKAEGTIKALEMALQSRVKPQQTLIHHSDRGVQYCCDDYVKLLKGNILISMTQNGDPKENAIAERVNGILKTEFMLKKQFASHAEAAKQVEAGIYVYNNLRPHLSCDYMKPAEAHLATGEMKQHWKTYYPKKGKEAAMEK